MLRCLIAFACAVLWSASGEPARADTLQERIATCSGCHGENGKPTDPSIPVIAGQHEGYIYLQLRDYKLGNRKNEIMQSLVADMEKADMKALAAYYAQQTWPALGQKEPPADVLKQARNLADSAVCESCHANAYMGDSAIPRAAGQGADYLRDTMSAFRAGTRANNPWMSALLKNYTDADIAALAQYLAGL